jgi:hypothetical protein
VNRRPCRRLGGCRLAQRPKPGNGRHHGHSGYDDESGDH